MTQDTSVRTQFPLAGTALEHTFNFRKDRKTGVQRESVTVNLRVPTMSELSHILSKEQEDNPELANVRELIHSSVVAVSIAAAKAIVDDNTNFQPEDMVKYQDEINLHHIANLPRAARGGITNAALEAFAEFFKEVAAERLGISDKAASNLSQIFAARKTFASYIGAEETREVLKVRLESIGETLSEEELAEHSVALTYLVSSIEELSKPKFDVAEL